MGLTRWAVLLGCPYSPVPLVVGGIPVEGAALGMCCRQWELIDLPGSVGLVDLTDFLNLAGLVDLIPELRRTLVPGKESKLEGDHS